MNVSSLMVKDVQCCGPESSLESAAMTMWNGDCGSVPVIDSSGATIGIITDRDIAMGSALNHKPLWDITASEVCNNRQLYTCHPGDDIQLALDTMAHRHIRRLPVVDDKRHLVGILSVDDVIMQCDLTNKKEGGLSCEQTVSVLKAVSKHH